MKIEIKNYKSIISETIDLNDSNVLYFVGRNESGKSNFLSAISNINNNIIDEINKNFNSNEETFIRYSWKLSGEIKAKWKEIGYSKDIILQEKIDIESVKYYPGFDKDLNKWIYSKLSKNYEINEEEKMSLFNKNLLGALTLKEDSEELEIKSQIIELINKSMELESSILIHSFKDFDLIKKKYTFQEALDSKSFMGLWTLVGQKEEDIVKLKDVGKETDEYLDLKSKIEKNLSIQFNNFIQQFWNQNTINFKINIEQNGFTVRAADVFDSEEVSDYKSLDFRSDGMKHYLTIVLFINFIMNQYSKLNNIILLDEPDKLLHAGAVTDLRKYLDKISKNNIKFVIATHNPYFIDEDNFHNISFVNKESIEHGSKIIDKFARKSQDENHSGIYPFLTKIGIDTKSFMELSTKKIVFVEGFHDLILLNAAVEQLKKKAEYKYLKKFLFIPLGSSTKIPSVVNLSISFKNIQPYFIFDYDSAGEKGFKLFKKNSFISEQQKNFTYINGYDKFKSNVKKIETQNLFDETLFDGKKISTNKNTKEYINFSIKIKSKKILLHDKTIKALDTIFKKIKKYYNI